MSIVALALIILVLVIGLSIYSIRKRNNNIKEPKEEKQKNNSLNKKIIIGVIIIFIIFGGIYLVSQKENKITTSNSTNKIDTIVSSVTAIDHLNKVYDLKSKVKSSAQLNSISTFNISSRNVDTKTDKDSNTTYYKVTLKGNCIGYWDEYDTKITQYKFTITADVYENGNIKNLDVDTEKAK